MACHSFESERSISDDNLGGTLFPRRVARRSGTFRTISVLGEGPPLVSHNPQETYLSPRRPSSTPPTTGSLCDASSPAQENVDRTQDHVPLEQQDAVSDTQRQGCIERKTAVYPPYQKGSEVEDSSVTGRGAAVDSAHDLSLLLPAKTAFARCPPCDGPSVQRVVEASVPTPRISLGKELEYHHQMQEFHGQSQVTLPGTKPPPERRSSKEAAACDVRNVAVRNSCSEHARRQGSDKYTPSNCLFTRFIIGKCCRRDKSGTKRIAEHLVQRSQPDRNMAGALFSTASEKRILRSAANKDTRQKSGESRLHDLRDETWEGAAPTCSSARENCGEQQHHGGQRVPLSCVATFWKTLQRCLRVLERCVSQGKGEFSTMMDRAFSRHAMLVYDYTWQFIVVSMLISGLMAVGLLFRKHENDMYKLYSFSGAPSHKIKNEFLSHFPRLRTSYIVAYDDNDSLKPETLAALHSIDAKIRNITLHRDSVMVDEFGDPLDRHRGFNSLFFPSTITFEDICARDSWGDCNVMSVLDMYTSSRSWGRPIISRRWPIVVNFRTKKAYRADAMLGNMSVVQKPHGDGVLHIIRNATAFGIRYDLMGEDGWEHYSAAAEQRIEEIVFQSEIPGMKLALRTERSISDDLSKSSQLGRRESVLLTVAVLIVLAYTLGVNSSLTFRTKTLPAFMGVLSTLLGYAGGAGFIYLCGLLHTPPAEATPFLVLGIGVDNAFVLINSYSLTFLIVDPRERIRHTTRDAGLAITCTTMTSVTALIIGAASPYASISMFCVITAFCLFWGYVMSLTFFLGWLVVDAQREARQQQRHSLQLAREVSETVAQKPKELGCLEEGEDTRPASPPPIEAESTLPSVHAQSATACIAQKAFLCEPPQAETTSPCTAGVPFPILKEACLHRESGNPGSKPDIFISEAGVLARLRRDRSPCSGAGKCEKQQYRQLSPAKKARIMQETMEVTGQPEQASQAVHVRDDMLSRPGVCAIGSSKEGRGFLRETIAGANETAILKQFEHMSTFQLASLMAFRSRLEKLLANERERNTKIQLAVSVGYTEGIEAASPNSSRGGHKRARRARLRHLIPYRRAILPLENTAVNPDVSGISSELQDKRRLRDSGKGVTESSVLCPLGLTKERRELDSTGGTCQHTCSGLRTGAFQNYLAMNAADLKHIFDTYLREPKGNVGRLGRAFLINYYCRLLAKTWIQAIILASFAVICGISIYGFTKIQPGITLDEICPKDSYLRTFFEVRSRYFSTLGEEITIFFPELERWEDKRLQNKLVEVHEAIYPSHHAVAVNNGMYHFIKQKQNDLIDGDKKDFLRALYTWLHNDLVGKQYRGHFIFSFPPRHPEERLPVDASAGPPDMPENLISWKFIYWMPHVENTSVLYEWLKESRLILHNAETHFHGRAYTPLAILWESDPYILRCTVSNLLYALFAIVLMTVLLIPNMLSMLIVALIVFLVDLALCGFMAIWGLRLNMLTMVILLLAIGYSVDTTTHVLNAFTRCCGRTRQQRLVETMVLMGNAIANGMLSTLIAVFFLKGSDKFVLEVFFKMMVLVLTFAFGFGFILLPVLLQLFGPMSRNDPVIKLLDTRTHLPFREVRLMGATNRCQWGRK